MLWYCLKCTTNTESKNWKFLKTKKLNNKCVVCDSKKLKFVKEQVVSGLLSGLGIRKPLSKIYLVGPLLIQKY